MGKILIIKGADFSKVAIGKVEPAPPSNVLPKKDMHGFYNTDLRFVDNLNTVEPHPPLWGEYSSHGVYAIEQGVNYRITGTGTLRLYGWEKLPTNERPDSCNYRDNNAFVSGELISQSFLSTYKAFAVMCKVGYEDSVIIEKVTL